MQSASTLLIVDDDANISSALASALQRPGRRIIVCSDAESAEIVLEQTPIDAMVTDMKLSGPFHYEGLDLLNHARQAAPSARLIGMSGSTADGLARVVQEAGGAFLAKPFETGALEEIIPPVEESQEWPICYVPTLEQIIGGGMIAPLFQRIVALATGETRAVEALARLNVDCSVPDITALFRYAERKHQTLAINLACIERALLAASSHAADGLIFLNVDPVVFANGTPLLKTLFRAAASANIALDRIVLELTEQHPFPESAEAFATVDALRAAGVRIAFDDLGVAWSHLPLVDRLRPSFFKISQQLGTGFESDPARMTIVRHLMDLAAAFHCELILEGIETEATLEAARAAGITLGQGFLFDTIGGK